MLDKNIKRAQFLKECRESRNISKAELARLLNFSSRNTIFRWENGESFPDEDILLKLSEIFEVSVEELRIGGRISQNANHKKEHKVRCFVVIILVIFLLISLYFYICFFNHMDKVEVYKLSLDTDNFIIDDSSLTLSRKVSILDLNQVKTKTKEEVKYIKLYFIDDNGEKLIIYGNNDNVYIEEKFGYHEYDLYKLKNIDLYIDIQTDRRNYEKIKIDKIFVNDFDYFYNSENIQNISDDSDNLEFSFFSINQDFLLKQGFIYNKEVETYDKSVDDKYYLLVDDRKISVSVYLEDDKFISIEAFADYDNYLYTEYLGNKIVETKEIVPAEEKNCNSKKCNSIDDYIQYITYLISYFR